MKLIMGNMGEKVDTPTLVSLMATLIDEEKRICVSTGCWYPFGTSYPGSYETFVRYGNKTKLIYHNTKNLKKLFYAHLSIVKEFSKSTCEGVDQ